MTTTNARLIASANTARGFAIGIIRVGKYFDVVRMDRQSRYVTISHHDDEATARRRANAEWRAERPASYDPRNAS